MALGDDDLGVFFNPEEHAKTAVYNGATPVDVIFDRAYLESLGIAGTSPQALGKASDFPVPGAVNKTLLIKGTTYTIKGVEPQDDGAIVLLRLSV